MPGLIFKRAFVAARLRGGFPGEERLAKLKALKKEWDGEGVFMRELLN